MIRARSSWLIHIQTFCEDCQLFVGSFLTINPCNCARWHCVNLVFACINFSYHSRRKQPLFRIYNWSIAMVCWWSVRVPDDVDILIRLQHSDFIWYVWKYFLAIMVLRNENFEKSSKLFKTNLLCTARLHRRSPTLVASRKTVNLDLCTCYFSSPR